MNGFGGNSAGSGANKEPFACTANAAPRVAAASKSCAVFALGSG
jgi:hypothetical protein